MRERLEPEIFRLPVDRLREGYYSDAYFNFTKQLLEERDLHPHVLMQVFQKERSVLGGIDEAIALLKLCSGRPVEGWETAELLEPYGDWAGLASVYLLAGLSRGLVPEPRAA